MNQTREHSPSLPPLDMCAEKIPLVSMGGRAGVKRAQTRERGPPSAVAVFVILFMTHDYFLVSHVLYFQWPTSRNPCSMMKHTFHPKGPQFPPKHMCRMFFSPCTLIQIWIGETYWILMPRLSIHNTAVVLPDEPTVGDYTPSACSQVTMALSNSIIDLGKTVSKRKPG